MQTSNINSSKNLGRFLEAESRSAFETGIKIEQLLETLTKQLPGGVEVRAITSDLIKNHNSNIDNLVSKISQIYKQNLDQKRELSKKSKPIFTFGKTNLNSSENNLKKKLSEKLESVETIDPTKTKEFIGLEKKLEETTSKLESVKFEIADLYKKIINEEKSNETIKLEKIKKNLYSTIGFVVLLYSSNFFGTQSKSLYETGNLTTNVVNIVKSIENSKIIKNIHDFEHKIVDSIFYNDKKD